METLERLERSEVVSRIAEVLGQYHLDGYARSASGSMRDAERLIKIWEDKERYGLASEDAPHEVVEQIQKAYRVMAKAACDVWGKPKSEHDLEKEATEYANDWWDEEIKYNFWIGCCDTKTRAATVLAVEAARHMCTGIIGNRMALALLKGAVKQLEQVVKK